MLEWQISRFIPLSFDRFQNISRDEWTSSGFQLLWSQQQSFSCDVGNSIQILAPGQPLLIAPLQTVRLASDESPALQAADFQFPALLELDSFPPSLKGHINPLSKQILMQLQAYQLTMDGEDIVTRVQVSSLLFFMLMECFLLPDSHSALPQAEEIRESPAHPSKAHKRKKSSLPIVYAVRYMRKHLGNPDLSLQEIAGAIGYNPNYFCQEFSHIFGVSPIRHLNELRVSKALHYLENTETPVKQICEHVGIRNPGNFTAMVKNRLGMTPIEYRRRYRAKTMDV
ncbi:AraC-like DNA-binding protein [Paenibacillus endophyticus]|uniref:AraC-like DNA-binding protein n=1 Tax=Paenibacillus endophyticus TaxID=1294268 RepID=A0A7W5GBA6_9BACL|nr:AraC family transcriptional regulator [Paenibacillus endophyticus]MBB3153596.1 AraC-like DNA-binding protein [Paenibacillus endophyticus]